MSQANAAPYRVSISRALSNLKIVLLLIGLSLLCVRGCNQEYEDALFYESLESGFYKNYLSTHPGCTHEQVMEVYKEYKNNENH